MDPSILAIPMAAALRNIAGWLENSLEDNKIEPYELGKLGATFLRMGAIGLAIFYGFNLGGIESASIAIIGDFLLSGVKKVRK